MNTKKIISGALSAALLITSSIGLVPIRSLAASASYSSGSARKMSISDHSITFESEYRSKGGDQPVELTARSGWNYEPRNRTYNCPAGKSKQALKKQVVSYALDRQTLNFVLTVPNKAETDTAEKIKELVSMNVIHSNGSSSVYNYFSIEAEKDQKKSNAQKNVYIMKGSFISYYGDSTVQLQFSSQLRDYDVSLSNVALSAANVGYLYSTVTDDKGQKLHISFEKSKDLSDAKYNEWLRSLGRYISSLSDISDIRYDDIYISFDDPTVEQPTSCCDYIRNGDGQNTGILIKFHSETSGYNCEQIMADRLDWGILHEISHAYSRLNDNSKCYEAFNTVGDEGLVNVRAITALQNCSQLADMIVSINGIELGSSKHALKNSADAGSYFMNALFDQLYIYDKYANSFTDGWAVIEKIILGIDGEMSIDALNGAIRFINGSDRYTYSKYGNNSISFTSRDTIRFINVLYALCRNHPEYGSSQEDFTGFLNDYVGIDRFYHYYSDWTKKNNFYNRSTIYSDIDGNRVFDIDDLQAVKDFVAGKRTLSPEGIYQADYNRDGYINEQDAAELEDMWF
ncbi:MAG: dockerin type I repeat-containing protein [Ruminococcus sp.]|uniref:dockerin type I repeat-containing protein n=1 Tax=Ruminococcus sp. TaxID=41978 RepID=UPI0025E0A747|nr:dockerin type I repeat-containing protein [Ruminococcus sp.]MBR5683580.1 dockerin type I repeat-containing protein [Ruminococcus sp.]